MAATVKISTEYIDDAASIFLRQVTIATGPPKAYFTAVHKIMTSLEVTGSAYCGTHPTLEFCTCDDAISRLSSSRDHEFTLRKWQVVVDFEIKLANHRLTMIFDGTAEGSEKYRMLSGGMNGGEGETPAQWVEKYVKAEVNGVCRPSDGVFELVNALLGLWKERSKLWKGEYAKWQDAAAEVPTMFMTIEVLKGKQQKGEEEVGEGKTGENKGKQVARNEEKGKQKGEIRFHWMQLSTTLGALRMDEVDFVPQTVIYGGKGHESHVDFLPMVEKSGKLDFAVINHRRCHPDCEEAGVLTEVALRESAMTLMMLLAQEDQVVPPQEDDPFF